MFKDIEQQTSQCFAPQHDLAGPLPENFSHLTFKDDKRVTQEVKLLRDSASIFLIRVLREYCNISVENVKVSILGQSEGVRSACFRVEQSNGKFQVVKLTLFSLATDSLALTEWHGQGACVPEIHQIGVLNTEIGEVHFVVMDLLRAVDNKPAMDGYFYLDDHHTLEETHEFGLRAGEQLVHMHRAATEIPFGGQDLPRAHSFAEMIETLLAEQSEILTNLGFASDLFATYLQLIKRFDSAQGVWVHGDFAPHNMLVVVQEPLKLAVIDPIAMVADSYWDLATAQNKLDWMREDFAAKPGDRGKKFKLEREEWYNKGLFEGYAVSSGKPVDQLRLKLNQIAQLLWKITKSERDGVHNLANHLISNHQFRQVILRNMLEELQQYV